MLVFTTEKSCSGSDATGTRLPDYPRVPGHFLAYPDPPGPDFSLPGFTRYPTHYPRVLDGQQNHKKSLLNNGKNGKIGQNFPKKLVQFSSKYLAPLKKSLKKGHSSSDLTTSTLVGESLDSLIQENNFLGKFRKNHTTSLPDGYPSTRH